MLMARLVDDGIEVVRDPEDTDGLLPIVDDYPALPDGHVYAGPIYLLADDEQTVRAVYDTEPEPDLGPGVDPVPAAAVLDAVTNATSFADLKRRVAALVADS